MDLANGRTTQNLPYRVIPFVAKCQCCCLQDQSSAQCFEKDSGLGEAFRAAVANPDGINIIDWKPYGPSTLFLLRVPPKTHPVISNQLLNQ